MQEERTQADLADLADDEAEAARVAADLNYSRNKATDFEREADRTARNEAMLRHLLREVS